MKNVFFSILIVFLLVISMLGNVNFVKADIVNVVVSDLTYSPQKMILGVQELENVRVSFTITNNRGNEIFYNVQVGNPTNQRGDPLSVGAITINSQDNIDTVNFQITRNQNTITGIYNGIITITELDAEENGNPVEGSSVEKSYQIIVENLNPEISTNLENSEIVLTSEEDNIVTKQFTLTNDGNINLANLKLTLTEGTFTDSTEIIRLRAKVGDGAYQALTLNQALELNPNTPLAPTNSLALTIEANIPDGIDLDTYTGKLKIEDTVRTQANIEIPVIIKIEPEVCSDGRVSDSIEVSGPNSGNLRLKIDNPDKGDDFKIGDEISIEVEVENKENKDKDIVVEAMLYDLDRAKRIIRGESESIEVEKNSKEDFDFIMEVPNDEDIDPSNTYILYIKAYEDGDEDKYCNYDSVEIDLEREDDDVLINTFTITPSVVYQNEMVSFNVLVENIGTDDQKDTYIKIKNNELKLDLTSNKFDLKKYDKSGNDKVETFTFTIPEDASAKEYFIEVFVYDKSGKQYDRGYTTGKLTVQSKEPEQLTTPEPETTQPTTTPTTTPTTQPGTYTPTGRSILSDLGSTKTLFIIGDIVLVILAVLFLVLIFKKR